MLINPRERYLVKKAREEGEKQGFADGEKHGEKQGFVKGELQACLRLAEKLLDEGFSIDEVSRLTELPKNQIKILNNS